MKDRLQNNVNETEVVNNGFQAVDSTLVDSTLVGKLADQLSQVKRQVFGEFQTALGANEHLLRLALIEADALAQQTGYPELIFPLLAAEKAQGAARWQSHQQYRLREESAYAFAA